MMKFFGSLKLTISLSVLLILELVTGSIIPQGKCSNLINSDILTFIKYFLLIIQACNIYHSPLFTFLCMLLLINLTVCISNSIEYKIKEFNSIPAADKKSLGFEKTGEYIISECEKKQERLKKLNYTILNASNIIKSQKGRINILAPIFIHLSVYILFAGITTGLLWGFKSYIALTPGQSLPIGEIHGMAYERGRYSSYNEDWQIKLNKFQMDYRGDNSIKQFYSDLSVTDNKESRNFKIWVNHPLEYKGVTFYQSSWDLSGLKMIINGKKEIMKARPYSKDGYIIKVDGIGKHIFYFNPNNDRLSISAVPFKKEGLMVKNKEYVIENIKLKYLEPVYSTGLSVKYDPGIIFIWLSFFILTIGLLLTLYSCKRIYIEKLNDNEYKIFGYCNKGLYSIEKDIEFLIKGDK